MESLGNSSFLLMDDEDIFNFPLDGDDGDDHSGGFPVSLSAFHFVFAPSEMKLGLGFAWIGFFLYFGVNSWWLGGVPS